MPRGSNRIQNSVHRYWFKTESPNDPVLTAFPPGPGIRSSGTPFMKFGLTVEAPYIEPMRGHSRRTGFRQSGMLG